MKQDHCRYRAPKINPAGPCRTGRFVQIRCAGRAASPASAGNANAPDHVGLPALGPEFLVGHAISSARHRPAPGRIGISRTRTRDRAADDGAGREAADHACGNRAAAVAALGRRRPTQRQSSPPQQVREWLFSWVVSLLVASGAAPSAWEPDSASAASSWLQQFAKILMALSWRPKPRKSRHFGASGQRLWLLRP